MAFQGYCPVCSQEIPKDRIIGNTVVCSCGWSDNSLQRKAERDRDKKTVKTFLSVAVIICALYGYQLSWGSHAWSVPFIKIQQWMGTLSPSGYDKLAQICISLNKWSCAQDAYVGEYQVSRNPEAFAKLAKLQWLLKQPQQSAQTYAAYYKAGGNNPEVAFDYATVLEQVGQVDEALKYYQVSIDSRPQTLPIFATTGMVRLLMQEKRYAQAYEKILAFHFSAENAKGYLNSEEAKCEQILGPKASKEAKAAQERRSRVAKS